MPDNSFRKVSIIGLGYIGLPTAAMFASRGLDVAHVGQVINYHLPKEMNNYLHRVGRTARAGRRGLVVNLVTKRDETLVAMLKSVRAHR